MKSSSALPSGPSRAPATKLAAAADFGLLELRNDTPLRIQLLPSGAVFALRHGPTLINQLLPGPAEDGLFRLLLRWRDHEGRIAGWAPLVGAGLSFGAVGERAAAWTSEPVPGLRAEVELVLHPTLPAWSWRVRLRNTSPASVTADVLCAQDLGLADEGAVRNNEAYTSQYIDLQPVRDEALGWVVLARQNQPMAQGRHPWLALAGAPGAVAYCTDGWQFFGADHRLTGEPAAVRAPALPSQRLQYECALAGLQSPAHALAPGEQIVFEYVARFVEDHPEASSPADVALVRAASTGPRTDLVEGPATSPVRPTSASLFVTAPWLHGGTPTRADWEAWFPGEMRHEERGPDGALQSFFQGEHLHVVSRDKEAAIARPHGHILRSGDARWFDPGHFGLTCYAAGIFAAQAYLGHPSFARLLSVVRNALNATRGSGQRVFVRRDGMWRQLGVPSAFAMTPGTARWLYRFGAEVLEAEVSCAPGLAAACLRLRVLAGAPQEFLITHELVLGATEFEHGGELEFHADGWVAAKPSPDSLVGRQEPGVCFAVASAEAASPAAFAGDGPLYADAAPRGGPYLTLQTPAVNRCGVLMLGTTAGPAALPSAVAAARNHFGTLAAPARPPAPPVRLEGAADPGVARVADLLPWLAHNAAIHFSAPHGLEQYGGAAWGVRDVCQGSVEWLLASGDFGVVRRILEVVFAQQYPGDGGWPQWFMFPPYRFIQQAHSHGDVPFWPVKALCDYLEATNDLAFLEAKIGYTDPERFEARGPEETVLAHCERVIAQCEARFVPGTALVNYGDGDWDDTLQPADPTLRTRMVSAWTVGLAFHTFRQLGEVCRRAGHAGRARRLDDILGRIRVDFAAHLLPGGIVAGFLVREPDGRERPLLHPQDAVTGIRYRLLPMTRSILAELFTPEEARRHLDLVESELRYPDGVRLMSEPSVYDGGRERLFKRAETAANVGREIGLQYVHAHLRYAEALAKMGEAEALWMALQVVNPVALAAIVPNAAPRQSNVYFSSSDADFADRYEARERWSELRTGQVAVRGGWRLYSSGPGLFLHKVRACLLGVREHFDEVVFDPVLPRRLDGLIAHTRLAGRAVELRYRVRRAGFGPQAVTVNGVARTGRREANPYRTGGLAVPIAELIAGLDASHNIIEIEL